MNPKGRPQRERADAGAAVIVTLHDPSLPHLSQLYDTRIEVAEIHGRRVFFLA